ncbi:MAG: sigma-70 family RNA polymerase sigma factor [Verrucomicrobia bacterium]|nr:MAG: sigma-70 family RNA polymerase sigma factor [Verrucomicrobiota bacterium]
MPEKSATYLTVTGHRASTAESSRTRWLEMAIQQHQSALIAYAMTIVNDFTTAQDVVQDTFLRLCGQPQNRVENHLRAWLFKVCRNRALDHLRREKDTDTLQHTQWKKIAGHGLQPDESAQHNERLAAMMNILRSLPENQREVIILKFQQGLSYREISEITGLKSGNIGFLIHSGLKHLRDLLPADQS